MDTLEKSKAPLTEHREDAVMEGSTCEPDLVFMRSVGGQVWEHLDVHSEFVPKMASISSDLRYSPQPGIILAWAVGCGRGKLFQFREYMKRTVEDSPHMRVLLFSANVLYGTNLDMFSGYPRICFLDTREYVFWIPENMLIHIVFLSSSQMVYKKPILPDGRSQRNPTCCIYRMDARQSTRITSLFPNSYILCSSSAPADDRVRVFRKWFAPAYTVNNLYIPLKREMLHDGLEAQIRG